MNIDQTPRPSYVTFEKVAIEDRAASIAQGHYVTKDEDYALITPPGSKDRIPMVASIWLADLKVQEKAGRIPAGWAHQYEQAFLSWKRGEEVPLTGTPIKAWPVLSPAERANVIAANVLTVEDLAQANGEALGRIGMGGVALKEKAVRWLAAAKDVGRVSQENERLAKENAILHEEVQVLMKQVQQLNAKVEAT